MENESIELLSHFHKFELIFNFHLLCFRSNSEEVYFHKIIFRHRRYQPVRIVKRLKQKRDFYKSLS